MSYQPSPSRLEAFSDGVIAVIITIMVLEFKVPHDDGWAGLRTILPTLAVYLLSYTFTGIYWINHHHLVHRLKHVDHLILWSNLGFLFCLSLLPFFTNCMIEKHVDSFSVEVYSTLLLITGSSFWLLQKAVGAHLRHTREDRDPRELALQIAEQRKALASTVMNLLAIPLAALRPTLGLAMSALVVLLWILPTFGLQHRDPECDQRAS
jgi:uncharacterized membrane protein